MSMKPQTGTGPVPAITTNSGSNPSPLPPNPHLPMQWPLFPLENRPDGLGTHERVFRPIHYLGSKLRMVDAVVEAVDLVDPTQGRVCDLFAGSGTVAGVLARTRNVTAVDIQEYSRVLCSALVCPFAMTKCQELMLASDEGSRLANATESIVRYEQESIKRALIGQPDMLNDFLEYGSLTRFNTGEFNGSQPLREVLTDTVWRLKEVGLNDSSSSLTTRTFGGVYFSYAQAVQLDILLDAVFSAPLFLRDLLLAAVLSTASEIVNTIGKQFAQPIRPKDKHGATKLKSDRQDT